MNNYNPYQPVLELTRGEIVESIHFGAFAVVDTQGLLLASAGDPYLTTFLRSSAKPFQALPFIERGGHEHFGFTPKEIALICASHSGTEDHIETIKSMHAKIGVTVDDLQCGMHDPLHQATRDAMLLRGEQTSPYRHNCSGKHTGMLAHARLRNLPLENYLELDHPIQQSILQTFAEMCGLAPEEVELGIDGCSAPNFAVPLQHAAYGFARLSDPQNAGLEAAQAKACRVITSSMMAHPEMVAGPDRFDTALMRVGAGKVVVKGGAEGYQAVGVLPGVLGADSPGIGIAVKISDGDNNDRARTAVTLSILKTLGVLDEEQLSQLADYGPVKQLYNFRKLHIGESRAIV